jgi:general stress protein 26
MNREAEISERFWKSLRSDRVVMLSLVDVEGGSSQPMTAIVDRDRPGSPVWFFTSSDTEFFRSLGQRHRAAAHFAAKDHELFASLEGELVIEEDPRMVDRLWNPFVAAWYEGGKSDPRLRLLRFEPGHAQVWLNENSVFAGLKLLLGSDPKRDYADKKADLDLGGRPSSGTH